MKIDIKVPSVGESITEATIGSWTKKNGDFVKRNEVILLLETDKASVEVIAESDGQLTITAQAGDIVQIGSAVGSLESSATAPASAPVAAAAAVTASAPTTSAPAASGNIHPDLKNHLSPATQRIVNEKGLDPSTISGTGKDGRLTKADVSSASAAPVSAPAPQKVTPAAPAFIAPVSSRQGDKKLVPMTTIRKRISEKLKEAQNTAALLTTFNEIDMSKVMELRAKYKDSFKEKHGLSLGFNGFFVKASVEALKAFPAVNGMINGTDIQYHNYYNVGIAVSTEKGLMVPVIKDADLLSVAGVEASVRNLALKGRDGKIGIDDLTGGTFSITNGGVFGSLLSTPILNFPQSAILGLHKIQDRPMAINGKVEIRPMMYVALTYDHRIIDGKEAVSFLVKIKELVEDPERLLLEV